MKIIDYADAEMMAINLANVLAGELRNALAMEDRVLFVVPGGTTPGPIFDALCDTQLDWDRVDVLLSDERWRPEVHVRSNTRQVRERLLTGRAAAARYLPLYAKADAPEAVLAELESNITPALPINICLLGMGTDLHVASLIAGADRLDEALGRRAPVLVPMRVPGAPEPRVTLSARVLNGAMSKHLVITGQAKRDAVERAWHMRSAEAPVAAVLDDMAVHWAPDAGEEPERE